MTSNKLEIRIFGSGERKCYRGVQRRPVAYRGETDTVEDADIAFVRNAFSGSLEMLKNSVAWRMPGQSLRVASIQILSQKSFLCQIMGICIFLNEI